MNENRLKMNPDKTEFIYFGSVKQLEKCHQNSINVVGEDIMRADCVRFLGNWLDKLLKFDTHVMKKVQLARNNLVKICRIRHFLDRKSCEIVVLALVMSHIDYCNSILYGISEKLIRKLQVVQNDAAKLILGKKRFDSSTKGLMSLNVYITWHRTTSRTCLSLDFLAEIQGKIKDFYWRYHMFLNKLML